MSGYFGIGIENGKFESNLGTLWRSAHNFGAAFIFTVGRRYAPQATDTTKAWRSIPLFHFADLDDLTTHLPLGALLVGLQADVEHAHSLPRFVHPHTALYLLGAEDTGLSDSALGKCSAVVEVPARHCLNVAVAGAVLMYDRVTKEGK